LTTPGESSGTVQLEIGAGIEMAFLQSLTANKTPHPGPVAPLASHKLPRKVAMGLGRSTSWLMF